MRRKLYCSPLAWKMGAFVTPFAVLALGIYVNVDVLIGAFWPLILGALILNMLIRKSLKVRIALCPRHRRIRILFISASWLCILGVFVGAFTVTFGIAGTIILLASIAALVTLAIVQSNIGGQAVRLKEINEKHVWLSGTGAAFRADLPEIN